MTKLDFILKQTIKLPEGISLIEGEGGYIVHEVPGEGVTQAIYLMKWKKDNLSYDYHCIKLPVLLNEGSSIDQYAKFVNYVLAEALEFQKKVENNDQGA